MDSRVATFVGCFLFGIAANVPAAEQIPEVTVEAERQRTQLRHDVDTFVSAAITISGGQDQVVARWAFRPLCPLVAGLPRKAGEFVLARISQIAKDAGAPLASENCKGPNLFVIVPADSGDFLKKLKAKRGAFNDEASKEQIEHFEKARPVRVWFNEGTVNLDGEMLADFLDTSGPRGKPFGDHYLVNQLPSQYGSRLRASTVNHDVISVIEIVDRQMAASLTINQLADYLAVAGLMQFDLDKDFGNAPTIMNVFRAPPDARAAGITEWDSALLHALYGVDRSSKLAVSDIEGRVFTSVFATQP